MPGPVEERIRNSIKPGKRLTTPSRHAPFKLAAYSESGIVITAGERELRTSVSWACLEEIPRFLIGRGWVPLSGAYDPATSTGTVQSHLESHGCSASSGTVAAVLVAADIAELEVARPVRVRLAAGAASLATAPSGSQLSMTSRRIHESEYRPHPQR